jgi:hypothetical protein
MQSALIGIDSSPSNPPSPTTATDYLMDPEEGIPWALREIEAMAASAEEHEHQAAAVGHYSEASDHRSRARAFKAAASLIKQAMKA